MQCSTIRKFVKALKMHCLRTGEFPWPPILSQLLLLISLITLISELFILGMYALWLVRVQDRLEETLKVWPLFTCARCCPCRVRQWCNFRPSKPHNSRAVRTAYLVLCAGCSLASPFVCRPEVLSEDFRKFALCKHSCWKRLVAFSDLRKLARRAE